MTTAAGGAEICAAFEGSRAMGDEVLRSPLYDRHVAAGAEMAVEAGWQMPARYGEVAEEMRQVRSRAGAFDLTHYGRVRVRGGGAVELLSRLCTADAVHQEDDTAIDTLLCNDSGGIVDLCRLLRLEGFWVLVTSPECRLRVLGHAQAQAEQFGAKVDDQTEKVAAIAVIGPEAPRLLDAVLPIKVSHLPDDHAAVGSVLVAKYIAVRRNVGDLWGIEVMLTHMLFGQAWRFITDKAGANAIAPCGMEAWESLRIAAGVPRHGREFDESTDPFAAGLEGLVSFDHEFIGADALARLRDKESPR